MKSLSTLSTHNFQSDDKVILFSIKVEFTPNYKSKLFHSNNYQRKQLIAHNFSLIIRTKAAHWSVKRDALGDLFI